MIIGEDENGEPVEVLVSGDAAQAIEMGDDENFGPPYVIDLKDEAQELFGGAWTPDMTVLSLVQDMLRKDRRE